MSVGRIEFIGRSEMRSTGARASIIKSHLIGNLVAPGGMWALRGRVFDEKNQIKNLWKCAFGKVIACAEVLWAISILLFFLSLFFGNDIVFVFRQALGAQ